MVTGTLVNYYVCCKRQCWLHAHGLTREHESETVKIGKYYHEEKFGEEDSSFSSELINGVKIDKIEGDYVIEYKKSNSSVEASEWQLLFYLWKLKQAGIIKKGILKFKENRNNVKVELTTEKERRLEQIVGEIEELLKQSKPPPISVCSPRCRKSAYRDFNMI